jgi:hypothetical protein
MTIERELQRTLNWMREWSSRRSQEWDAATRVTAPLYHYTDLQAFEGILEKQEFWFTDAFHLNDTRELAHGVEVAVNTLRSHPLAASGPVTKFFCDEMARVLSSHLSDLFSFLVVSFTPLRDDLNQWRAYGDRGRGVAIGLTPSLFHPVPANPIPKYSVITMPMVYEADVIEKRIQEIVTLALGWLLPLNSRWQQASDTIRRFLRDFGSEVTTKVVLEVLTAKHPAFSSEKEVRLLITAPNRTCAPLIKRRIRPATGETIPYLAESLPLLDNGIHEIVIGPAAPLSTGQAVRALLSKHGLNAQALVQPSKIPLRT